MNKIVMQEGKEARKKGKALNDNPYFDRDTELAHHWEKGFNFSTSGRPNVPPPPPVKPVA